MSRLRAGCLAREVRRRGPSSRCSSAGFGSGFYPGSGPRFVAFGLLALACGAAPRSQVSTAGWAVPAPSSEARPHLTTAHPMAAGLALVPQQPEQKAPSPLPARSGAPWQVVWRFQTAAPIAAAPAVSAGGEVYLASAEGYLHALDDEGRVRWSRAIDGSPIGEPALDPQGNVYITTSSAIIALHADGRSS